MFFNVFCVHVNYCGGVYEVKKSNTNLIVFEEFLGGDFGGRFFVGPRDIHRWG